MCWLVHTFAYRDEVKLHPFLSMDCNEYAYSCILCNPTILLQVVPMRKHYALLLIWSWGRKLPHSKADGGKWWEACPDYTVNLMGGFLVVRAFLYVLTSKILSLHWIIGSL